MDKILRLNSTELEVDYTHKIAKVSFVGDIKLDDYKEALLSAAELVRSNGIENIIMDRSKIEKLDAECRVWVKNEYLKIHIKPLIPKLNKVAVVDSTSIVGQLYGQAIYKTLSIVYPTLTFKFFTKPEKVMPWLGVKERELIQKENKLNTSHHSVDQTVLLRKPVQKTAKKEKVVNKVISPQVKHSSVVGRTASAESMKKSLFERFFNALFPKFN